MRNSSDSSKKSSEKKLLLCDLMSEKSKDIIFEK